MVLVDWKFEVAIQKSVSMKCGFAVGIVYGLE